MNSRFRVGPFYFFRLKFLQADGVSELGGPFPVATSSAQVEANLFRPFLL